MILLKRTLTILMSVHRRSHCKHPRPAKLGPESFALKKSGAQAKPALSKASGLKGVQMARPLQAPELNRSKDSK